MSGRAALALLAGVMLLAGCGSAVDAQPAWVSGHPSTAVLTFETTAPGVCAITVRYPDEAPAAIAYLGSIFVQVGRMPHATPAPGALAIDHSADWQVTRQGGGGDLLLLTPSSTYDYRLEGGC